METIQTTARKNPVAPFTPDQAPLTPRKKGFLPLKPYKEPPLAPHKPRSSGTLDGRAATAFREAVLSRQQRSATLKLDHSKITERGYSYLEGPSAQEALTGKPSEEPEEGNRSPTPEPPDHTDTLKPPPSSVPPLKLEGVFDVRDMPGAYTDKFDEAFVVNKGKPVTLEDLNDIFGAYIPQVRRDLDPDVEEHYAMHPFHLEQEQLDGIAKTEKRCNLTFGRCGITDPMLEFLVRRNPNLVEVVLFDCANLEYPSFLAECLELEELCLSWCSKMKFGWFTELSKNQKAWAKLESLELANTDVTDSDLMDLRPLPSLTFIDLSHCKKLTDEGFLALFKQFKLVQIRIDGTNISEDAIAKMKSARPGLEIVRSTEASVLYIETPAVEETVVITHQSAEFYPFLRKYMFEVHGIDTWSHLSELEKYADGIQKYFRQELEKRQIVLFANLSTPEGWFLAERAIQEKDGPNLDRIMKRLVPILRSQGYFKAPVTPQGKMADVELDCYVAFWEITVYPNMLNRIYDLNLSNAGITEIPHCFSFFFPRLRTLNLSGNPLKRLPEDYIDAFPRRCVQSFFSRFPALEKLDCSNCDLTLVPEGFFTSLTSTEGETVPILTHLKEVDFSRNRIERLPDHFGISKEREAAAITMNFVKNDITYIHQKALDDLGDSDPIKVTVDLRDNVIYAGLIALHMVSNTTIIRGLNVGRFVRDDERNAGLFVRDEEKKE
ncbi:MAG: hypothetical protein K1X28_10720 [Parachlamydiales bacterium]|nr:hypothetical protein [Parachlamydiales bacterium]